MAQIYGSWRHGQILMRGFSSPPKGASKLLWFPLVLTQVSEKWKREDSQDWNEWCCVEQRPWWWCIEEEERTIGTVCHRCDSQVPPGEISGPCLPHGGGGILWLTNAACGHCKNHLRISPYLHYVMATRPCLHDSSWPPQTLWDAIQFIRCFCLFLWLYYVRQIACSSVLPPVR